MDKNDQSNLTLKKGLGEEFIIRSLFDGLTIQAFVLMQLPQRMQIKGALYWALIETLDETVRLQTKDDSLLR